ncbi:hypothetical protein CHS0354_006067, partial [Potamilus streckersoni]
VLAAEIVKHYFPKLVELHNYSPAAATKQKQENWYLFNRRVLKKLDLDLSDEVIKALANSKPRVIEKVLLLLRLQIDKFLEKSDTPPGDSRSPRVHDAGAGTVRSMSPQRQIKSEPPLSPRKYARGEIPHGHPDRSHYKGELVAFFPRSYLTDSKPYVPDPRTFMAPVTDNVPRILYEEREMECMAKEETIKILNAKINRLEHLLHLKDVRIEDLTLQINQAGLGGYSNRKR